MKEMRFDELAAEFVRVPIEVFGVYRTRLEAGEHPGHRDEPTQKCALLIPLAGKATFDIDGTPYLMEPGTVLLGGVNARLEINVPSAVFEYFLVHYLPVPYDPSRKLRMTSVNELRLDIDPPLLQLIQQLQRIAAEPDNLSILDKRTLFYRLVGKSLSSERYEVNKESSQTMELAMQYLRDNYMEPVTLESLAERYGMKPKYFSHLFRKFTGIGPIQYLISYRMNRASQLLETTLFSVGEVARSVGYADAYYFSRLYKKHLGLSPNAVKSHASRNNPS